MSLFEDVNANRWFADKDVILFLIVSRLGSARLGSQFGESISMVGWLQKSDVLREKIQRVPFSSVFPDFKAHADAEHNFTVKPVARG